MQPERLEQLDQLDQLDRLARIRPLLAQQVQLEQPAHKESKAM